MSKLHEIFCDVAVCMTMASSDGVVMFRTSGFVDDVMFLLWQCNASWDNSLAQCVFSLCT